MFYSETILSRRGPLGKVWLAAHMERKLSKTQTLQTDIEKSVGAIMGQEVEVMALRLSGQLLLGVVRIYSRKAKYLLDDCNEALLKIKMAFRPGMVDMTEDQLAVNKNAITLQGQSLDLDILLPDVNWDLDFEDRPLAPQGHHQANADDITLRTADAFQNYDANDPFDIGPSDGIGSQDFLDLDDLGLTFDPHDDNENMSVDGSVGVGRDLPVIDDSFDAQFMPNNGDMDMDIFSNHSKSRGGSEHPFNADINPDIDMPDIELPGDNYDREKTPGPSRSSRASSPLSDAPCTPPPEDPTVLPDGKTPTKVKRKVKEKKQIIDSVTELEGGPGAKVGKRNNGLGPAVTTDVSGILIEQQFLPRSSVMMRLLEIRDDPIAHFLPTKVTPNGTFFCAAPPGLAPELAELFMRPITTPSSKRRGASPEKGSNKRPRLDGSVNGDDEIEQARRDSRAPSMARSDLMGRAGSTGPDGAFDFGDPDALGMESFQLEVPPELEVDVRGKSAAPSELSRLSTPMHDAMAFDEGVESYADATCPIVMFDVKPSTQSQAVEDAEPIENEGKGYSKNTVKALGIIRKELKPVDGEEDEDKALSFRKMADKASRRAAASFFFELLVLGTRDCVHLTQDAPFENIEVRAKDKLWEQQRHASVAPSRGASVARSIGSAMGL
ncbi:Rec8 like protein-domain-containing protein [Mycena alexandri]|uniref:Rec8 like protein-domain-containing protein n=1 Tax=Mycena alexandri TaxID=1745969 RepID=A0AAD6TF59_9AGAR|nr:Rec8 like protein-domain-containing protein [Mycena alexandri]